MILTLIALLSSTPGLAYKDGTFTCKNGDPAMPDNTYSIQSVTVPGTSDTLPYVTATRYFRGPGEQPSVRPVVIRGLAVVSDSGTPANTVLSLNQLRLEFSGDEMTNCRR
jgi:hypothetical protein